LQEEYSPAPKCLDERAKAAVAALDSINAELRVGNEQMKKDPGLGIWIMKFFTPL
jgi:hypothetical protein